MTNTIRNDGGVAVDEVSLGGESTGELTIDTSGLAPAEPLADEAIAQDEQFLDAHDGEKLFYQTWYSEEAPASKGVVALMHGYGEHSSRYDHVAGALVRAGYAVGAIDARGHGRSTGKRAHVSDFDDYVRDYDRLVEATASRWPERPHFALGHSNGGLIVLQYALDHPRGVDGFVTTSPFLGFAVEVPAVKAAAGHVLSRIWPTFSMPNGVDPSVLSHDEHVVEKYERDPLVLKVATGRWFTEARSAQEELVERVSEIEAPCLFLVAGSDELADPARTDEVFHRLGGGDREMDIYPELKHEILNERNWGRIVERMVDWMRRHGPVDSTEEAA